MNDASRDKQANDAAASTPVLVYRDNDTVMIEVQVPISKISLRSSEARAISRALLRLADAIDGKTS